MNFFQELEKYSLKSHTSKNVWYFQESLYIIYLTFGGSEFRNSFLCFLNIFVTTYFMILSNVKLYFQLVALMEDQLQGILLEIFKRGAKRPHLYNIADVDTKIERLILQQAPVFSKKVYIAFFLVSVYNTARA